MRVRTMWFVLGLCLGTVVLATGLGCGGVVEEERVRLDVSGADPFTQAVVYAKTGEIDMLRDCLSNNPDLTAQVDRQGMTLLHFAAGAGHADAVELLLEQGANVNAQSGDGQTPLSFAEEMKVGEKVTELLRDAGAR